MPKLINSDDFFEVQFASIVTDYDRLVLLRLYQPIVGYGPISIYLTLASEMEAERTISTTLKTHNRLFEVMGITADKFLKCRRHLEAIGLLKTFINESDKGVKYIYRLKAPYLPNQFYEHPVLVNLLKKYLSEEEYDRTKLYFSSKIAVKPSFKDISADFSEVYNAKDGYNITDDSSQIKKREEAVIATKFDYEAFWLGLKEYQVPKSLFDKKITRLIGEYATIYNISAMQMRDIIIQTLVYENDKKIIDLNRLDIFVKRFGDQNNNQEVSKPKKVEKPTLLTGDSQIKSKVDLFNDVTPVDFLTLLNNNKTPIQIELQLIADLKRELSLTDPVINVLLDYCMETNNKRLVTNYVKKVASSLMRNDISDAYQAMNYLAKHTKKGAKNAISQNDVSDDDVNKSQLEKEQELLAKGLNKEDQWW